MVNKNDKIIKKIVIPSKGKKLNLLTKYFKNMGGCYAGMLAACKHSKSVQSKKEKAFQLATTKNCARAAKKKECEQAKLAGMKRSVTEAGFAKEFLVEEYTAATENLS